MYERICRLSCHLYILRYLYFLAYIINFSICPGRASCQRVPCLLSLYVLVLYTYTMCIYHLHDDSSRKPRLMIFRCICNSQLLFVREVCVPPKLYLTHVEVFREVTFLGEFLYTLQEFSGISLFRCSVPWDQSRSCFTMT